jgi:hypothetical protein
MNNLLLHFDKNIAPRLGSLASEYRKLIQMLFAKNKQSYLFIFNGTLSQDPQGQPIYPLIIILDAFLTYAGVDGKIVAIENGSASLETLTKYTSDNVIIVNDDLVNVLHGLANNPNAEIDLLFLGGHSSEDVDTRGTTIPKNIKTMPAIEDAIGHNCLVVIDHNQQGTQIAQEVENCAKEEDKKCFLNGIIKGWVW